MKANSKNKQSENLSSGYILTVVISVVCFLAFYFYGLNQLYSGNVYTYNKNNMIQYICSVCVFGISFIASCVLVSFIPKKLTSFLSSKELPILAQISVLVVSIGGFIFLLLNCLLVSEVDNPPYAIGYATAFYWRQLPLWFIIAFTAFCVVLVAYLVCRNIETNKVCVYFVYAIVILLAFIHNLYLNNYDRHHHAAAYDSVYNCFHGVPYDRFTTGIYGHYGIFIALILRIVNGDAISMFVIHALIAAIEIYIYIYIIHNCIQKNIIKIISALAGMFCVGVLAVFMHWQSVPIRNLGLLVIIAYTVWMYKHNKFKKRHIVLGYIISSLCVVWNTESGIAASLAFTAGIIIHFWQEHKWYEKKMLVTYPTLIGLSIVSIFSAVGFVNIYNFIFGGKIIFKAFFYPYFESSYMDSWGANSGINVALGNHTWIYTLISFALLLLMGVYYTKFVNPKKDHLNPLAPVYAVTSVAGFGMYIYYASRPVYLSLDTVFYFVCIALALFADKFTVEIPDVLKKKCPFVKTATKSLGCISLLTLTVFASQMVFTSPNLLNKAQSGMFDAAGLKQQASQIDKAIPGNAFYIGTDSCVFKLQLKRKSPYYYRHNDMFAPGYEYCDKLIEEARKSDYVALSIYSGEDTLFQERFTQTAPEYTLISVNNIGGVEYRLFSKLKEYTCSFLAHALPVIGESGSNQVKLTLKPGSMQYGPYIDLKPGDYNIKICGEGLNQAGYDVLANGALDIPTIEILQTDTEIQYSFVLDEPANIEFRTFNNTDGDIVLDEIKLTARVS